MDSCKVDLTVSGMGWERIFALVIIWCFGVALGMTLLCVEVVASTTSGGQDLAALQKEKRAKLILDCLFLEEVETMIGAHQVMVGMGISRCLLGQ